MRNPVRRIAYSSLPYIDSIITLGLAVTVAILGYSGVVSPVTVQAVTLGVLSLISLNLIRDRSKWQVTERQMTLIRAAVDQESHGADLLADARRAGLNRILGGVVDYDWLSEIRQATDVTIVKIKANFTNNPEYSRAMEDVIQRGGRVRLVISDPRSPATLLRYFDEPTTMNRERAVRSSRNSLWVNGLEEIAADIHRLGTWRQRLDADGKNVSRLMLGLSSVYPTHAFLKFDNRLYVYQYPYMSRGFHAPCMLLTHEETPTYAYLVECMEAVVDASAPLDESSDAIWSACRAGDFADKNIERFEIVKRRGKARPTVV